MSEGTVSIVGAGPGDPGLVTVRAADLLSRAGVLFYDAGVGEPVLSMVAPGCERHEADGTPERLAERMAEHARNHASIVRLHRGDPLIDGSAEAEARVLHANGVRFEIVPGICLAALERAVEQRGDRRPLSGKRVLITRPANNAHAFARALYARGVEPIFASTIAIGPPDDHVAAHAAIDRLAEYGWLVFTSQNGVDAFFERLRSLDADARYVGKTKVAAIGSKTADRLREHGVHPDLVPRAFVGEEIARALIEATRDGERVLIFRAQEGRDVLPQMLEEAGRHPHVVAAYKTIFEADPQFAEKVARADVVTFTSASSVRGFLGLLNGAERAIEAVHGKLIACIGPVTAEAAVDAGLHVDVVADVSTTDGLLDALEAHVPFS
jgi:uroporphyrinogen-III synthase